MKKRVSIIVPAYNEEESLPLFYNELCRVINPLEVSYEFEIVFINDGSRDNTLNILHELHLKDSRMNYIDMSRNFGKEIGMLAGFDTVTGDCVIIMDADLQEPPEVIPLMLEKWEEGYDDVYGLRRTRQQSTMKKLSSRLYHRMLENMSDVDLTENAGDFRLLDRKCIDALRSLRESQRYTKGMYSWIGFRKAPVEYDIHRRVAGTSKWNVRKLVHLAVDGITSHSVMPLKMASYMGLIVSAIAFVYLIYILIKSMIYGDPVAGFPTLISVVLFLGGFILLALGIIGEYLGRIFLETKMRPPYFINSINGDRAVNFKNQKNENKETC